MQLAFGRRLAALRERKGITPFALAKQVEVSATFIYGLESGDKMASEDLLGRIAEVLGVSKNMLLAWRDEEKLGPERVERMKRYIYEAEGRMEALDALMGGLQVERQNMVANRAHPDDIKEREAELMAVVAEFRELGKELAEVRKYADSELAKRTEPEQAMIAWLRAKRFSMEQVATLRHLDPELLSALQELAFAQR